MAGHRLRALEGGGGEGVPPPLPMHPWGGGGGALLLLEEWEWTTSWRQATNWNQHWDDTLHAPPHTPPHTTRVCRGVCGAQRPFPCEAVCTEDPNRSAYCKCQAQGRATALTTPQNGLRTRLAISVCPLRYDQMGQGPTEPHAGRGAFLLSSGGAGGGGGITEWPLVRGRFLLRTSSPAGREWHVCSGPDP